MAVNKTELDRAVRAALNGPEVRDVRFADYRFNVKPAKISRSGNTLSVVGGEDGYISRRRRARANDRIYYEFDKTGGFIHLDEIDIEIDRGGVWRGIWRHRNEILDVAVKVAKVIERVLRERKERPGGPGGTIGGVGLALRADVLTDEEQEQVASAGYEESKRLLDGSWEAEAEFLIVNIALRAG